ncbi:MAG: cytochrome c3 family protein [Phycisphaeraceae bacterium]|nr:cytochrome c3 family protein [Phycisphaeraceae bacterium]MCW5761810.1 cytochrome c3 family protein [Phycisphaeraceae bacterium]
MSALFPRWMNTLPTILGILGVGGAVATVGGVTYYATPSFWEVGYMPTQPGSGFNHQLHAGKLGIDCLYCHTHVESSSHSNVPPVATCYGCHAENRLRMPGGDEQEKKVAFIREAYAENKPIPWREIHILPDYVQFPHLVHIEAGVSCYSCHGQITAMPVVAQQHSLAMGWCLDCHRDPEPQLVPREKVTDLVWVEQEWMSRPISERRYDGLTPEALRESLLRDPPQHCAACHY